jgi:hypothetical protein
MISSRQYYNKWQGRLSILDYRRQSSQLPDCHRMLLLILVSSIFPHPNPRSLHFSRYSFVSSSALYITSLLFFYRQIVLKSELTLPSTFSSNPNYMTHFLPRLYYCAKFAVPLFLSIALALSIVLTSTFISYMTLDTVRFKTNYRNQYHEDLDIHDRYIVGIKSYKASDYHSDSTAIHYDISTFWQPIALRSPNTQNTDDQNLLPEYR